MELSATTDRGFTLVEALASMLILSIALATLMPAMLDGLHRIGASNERMLAAEIAQSLLDRVDIDPDFRDTQGVADGGFLWRIEISPVGSTEDRRAWIYVPDRVSITVSWNGGAGSVRLSRLRLARKERT